MKCLIDLNFTYHVLMAFAKRYILCVWQGSEYASAIQTYLKLYQYQPNTNSIWEVVFEKVDQSLEYVWYEVPYI